MPWFEGQRFRANGTGDPICLGGLCRRTGAGQLLQIAPVALHAADVSEVSLDPGSRTEVTLDKWRDPKEALAGVCIPHLLDRNNRQGRLDLIGAAAGELEEEDRRLDPVDFQGSRPQGNLAGLDLIRQPGLGAVLQPLQRGG